jgi:hypothetical protein
VDCRPVTRAEEGVTLVELLVGIFIFALISTAFYQLLFSVARGTKTTESVARTTDEARLGFNRMVRDTREAQEITEVSDGGDTFRVEVDFNADGDTLDELEDLTYSYNSSAGQIRLNGELLMAGVSCVEVSGVCRPVFDYTSENLEYDWSDPPDGVVTSQELDEAPSHGVIGVGNDNGVLDEGELPYISSVLFNVRVTKGGASYEFHGRAQLRNNR